MYFDDFKITHVELPIIQSQDYYPFGLAYNQYVREEGLDSRFKFQGQEHIDAASLNWDAFKWRNHQPDIGRFFNVDPLSEKYYYNSPYAFSENSVTRYRELEGLEKVDFMVATYEPDKPQPRNEEEPFNTTPKDVIPSTSQQNLNFRVDFQTGDVSLARGTDSNKPWYQMISDEMFGDGHSSLEYKMDVNKNENTTTIKIQMREGTFEISGTTDSDKLEITTTISGTSKNDAAVVQAGGAHDPKSETTGLTSSVVGDKTKGNTHATGTSNFTFFLADDGGTYIYPVKK